MITIQKKKPVQLAQGIKGEVFFFKMQSNCLALNLVLCNIRNVFFLLQRHYFFTVLSQKTNKHQTYDVVHKGTMTFIDK